MPVPAASPQSRGPSRIGRPGRASPSVPVAPSRRPRAKRRRQAQRESRRRSPSAHHDGPAGGPAKPRVLLFSAEQDPSQASYPRWGAVWITTPIIGSRSSTSPHAASTRPLTLPAPDIPVGRAASVCERSVGPARRSRLPWERSGAPPAGSAARRRCRPCGRWSPRRRPPNRTCDFHRIRLSMSTTSGCPLARLSVGHGVPAALRQRRAGVHRRPPPVRSCRVLTGPLRPAGGSPALPGGSLLPRLLRVLRQAPAATADGAPALSRRARRAPPGCFPRSLIRRSAGSAPSCTPGASPRATATRRAASPARAATGRARRPPTRTGPSAPTAHSRQFRGWCPVSGLQPLVSVSLRLSALLADPARWRRTVPPSSRAACRPTPHLRRRCCPPASPGRYGGRGWGLTPHPVIWRLVAQSRARRGAALLTRAAAHRPREERRSGELALSQIAREAEASVPAGNGTFDSDTFQRARR